MLKSYVLINREQVSQLVKGVSSQKLSSTIAASVIIECLYSKLELLKSETTNHYNSQSNEYY